MPIEAPTLEKAARQFCDHLNRLLATTVTQHRLSLITLGNRVQLAFRQAGLSFRPRLKTKYGQIAIYIGQLCEAVPVTGAQRLVTTEYKYTLGSPAQNAEPVFRWEYLRHWPSAADRWCRHHLQGDVSVCFGKTEVYLNDLHLPTGYVTLEEVLRFCIVDLGVKPLKSDWHTILEESYQRFKKDFAG